MLHLIAFESLHAPLAAQCLALYRDGDVCVFTDGGERVAARFPLRGAGYVLATDCSPTEQTPLATANLETIDHHRLVALMATHGPVTSWYPNP